MSASKLSREDNQEYRPKVWEKVFVYITITVLLGVVSYVLIRNNKINDPNFVVVIKVFLSISMAGLGVAIPGLLSVDFSSKGWTIRATGAMALFTLTYIFTPAVLVNDSQEKADTKSSETTVSQTIGNVNGTVIGVDASVSNNQQNTNVDQVINTVEKGGHIIGVKLQREAVNEIK